MSPGGLLAATDVSMERGGGIVLQLGSSEDVLSHIEDKFNEHAPAPRELSSFYPHMNTGVF